LVCCGVDKEDVATHIRAVLTVIAPVY